MCTVTTTDTGKAITAERRNTAAPEAEEAVIEHIFTEDKKTGANLSRTETIGFRYAVCGGNLLCAGPHMEDCRFAACGPHDEQGKIFPTGFQGGME